jgi:hypothetical protein
LLHHVDSVGPSHGISGVVRHKYNGRLCFALPGLEQLNQALLEESVHMAKWFVEQKHLRTAQQRSTNREALLLSARQAVGRSRRVHTQMKGPHYSANDAIFLVLKPPMHQIKEVVAQASVGR